MNIGLYRRTDTLSKLLVADSIITNDGHVYDMLVIHCLWYKNINDNKSKNSQILDFFFFNAAIFSSISLRLKTYNRHQPVCGTETSISMMTPPISSHAPFCWKWIERAQRASKHSLGSRHGPRRPFKFTNCALARLTHSISIQRYSITKKFRDRLCIG